ncbi:MAG: hypothetical protein EOO65_04080 [Methanosarcinales archaeon]|nr:MAG: hypothetical protein EOO65_04080 [Methanosarcinales archaeon]
MSAAEPVAVLWTASTALPVTGAATGAATGAGAVVGAPACPATRAISDRVRLTPATGADGERDIVLCSAVRT